MEEKKNQPCPNCGQSASRDFITINGKLYCGMCRPHEDRTVETGADDGADKTQVLQTGAERTQPDADADRTTGPRFIKD